MIDRLDLIDCLAAQRFLLEKTQHTIGGFGKGSGDLPGKKHYSHGFTLRH